MSDNEYSSPCISMDDEEGEQEIDEISVSKSFDSEILTTDENNKIISPQRVQEQSVQA